MARIRILELPMVELGEYMKTPFSIIIDQLEGEQFRDGVGTVLQTFPTEMSQEEADRIAHDMGAVSAILVQGTLDLA